MNDESAAYRVDLRKITDYRVVMAKRRGKHTKAEDGSVPWIDRGAFLFSGVGNEWWRLRPGADAWVPA